MTDILVEDGSMPQGKIGQRVFITARVRFESSMVIPASRVRATTMVRVNVLSKPLTRTSRKNPPSASCEKPYASFASVLFAAISSGTFA